MLIATRLDLGAAHRVCAFVVSDWRTFIVGVGRSDDTSYIEDFIYDLRQLDFLTREEAQRVFDEIGELSLGPLRTAHSGSCPLQDLPIATREVLERSSGVTLFGSNDFFALLSGLTVCDQRQQV